MMIRKIVTATASAALCLSSVSPAFAQNYRFSGFDAPRGATATVNLRVPLGSATRRRGRPTASPWVTARRSAAGARRPHRQPRHAASPTSASTAAKLAKAQVLSFDLANLDNDRRLNMAGTATIRSGSSSASSPPASPSACSPTASRTMTTTTRRRSSTRIRSSGRRRLRAGPPPVAIRLRLIRARR